MVKSNLTPADGKAYITKDDYYYTVTSPVILPGGQATISFENLTKVKVKVTLPKEEVAAETPEELDIRPGGVGVLTLRAKGKRFFSYRVDIGKDLQGMGNSAPVIIRER